MILLALLAPLVIQADLDGRAGSETISYENDKLSAGGAEIEAKMDRPAGTDGTVHLDVVSIGKRRLIYLATHLDGDEDPPVRHRVFLYEKGLLKEAYNAVWQQRRITWSKHGGRILEDGWGACLRMQEKTKKPVAKAKQDLIQIKLVGSKIVETRKPSGKVQKCDELSACPFVYEIVDGKQQLIGEILRNVRYQPALQALWLGEGQGATIRLTEEKPEVTFLDEIYLEVDGVRVSPAACIADPKLAYCSADERYHVMSTGAVLPLEFAGPKGKRNLFARGYYNPMTADR